MLGCENHGLSVARRQSPWKLFLLLRPDRRAGVLAEAASDCGRMMGPWGAAIVDACSESELELLTPACLAEISASAELLQRGAICVGANHVAIRSVLQQRSVQTHA
eukprot:3554695-Pyramimonas_sp.AAC.1